MSRGRAKTNGSTKSKAKRSRNTYEKKLADMSKSERKLGAGGRFEALSESIEQTSKKKGRKKVENPGAVAAAIGRKKYGAKKMAKMAAEGKKK